MEERLGRWRATNQFSSPSVSGNMNLDTGVPIKRENGNVFILPLDPSLCFLTARWLSRIQLD
jgi:hypothetical protein